MPKELQPLLEKAQELCKVGKDHLLNLALVNYYPSKSKSTDPPSYMPAHSDNEFDIAPGSEIATFSLGATRTISFSEIHGSGSSNIDVEHNSLYTMTRRSQAFYKHSMLDVEATGERYSITLRCANPNLSRSTVIMGDSNTKDISFGEGKGKIGERYPGERVKAGRIRDIDPSRCVEFSNVVLVCGTNDLRPENNPNLLTC